MGYFKGIKLRPLAARAKVLANNSSSSSLPHTGIGNKKKKLTSISLLTVMMVFSSLTLVAAADNTYPYGEFASANYNARSESIAFRVGEGLGEGALNPSVEQYDNRAYPNDYIDSAQIAIAQASYLNLPKAKSRNWEEVGPITPNVAAVATYTGRATKTSGRITSLAVDPKCGDEDCRLYVGAAGGGVWVTENALETKPEWKPLSKGMAVNAIGSILIDPTDKSGKTVYVGTGEPNGSSDSEAGVGLYKSTNRGSNWQIVPGSVAVAKDRAIAGVAVDPQNANHIFIGTAVARHGSSSVNGGRFTPPGAPVVGLYESTNGGSTFNLVFSKASDVVDPGSANGNDFFRGGVSKVEIDRTGLSNNQASRVYFSMFGYGLFRKTQGGTFEQVFASAGGGSIGTSAGSRTEFSLAPMGNKLRIYLGDTDGNPADFYRVDDANVSAAALTDGTANPGWLKLSNSTEGTPGFSSYNYCGGQCSYDMPVASPPGRPDSVWIGGQMQYDEIFTATPPSNGRAVQRSTNAGVGFTDMTNDNQKPAPLGMHPDQHAIVFNPKNPDIAFLGSDGGLVRTSGQFVDDSASCDTRGLTDDVDTKNLTNCKMWLKAIPTKIFSLNDGLAILQFQSVSVDAKNPRQIMGGTQDNGTWAYNPATGKWFETVGGDGGQSGFNVANSNIRFHSYYGAQHDINFRGDDPMGWNWISDVLGSEAGSFYVPIITDPVVGGTMFVGQGRVWRTQDNGGDQAFLEQYCNELTGDYGNRPAPCGDWVPLGGSSLVGSAFGTTKGGSYVVAVTRASSNKNTLWAGTRRGRLFISNNADAANNTTVTFTRVDGASQPTRFISGIAVDAKDANHVFVSYSGYDAYAIAAGTATGHVFEVRYNPTTGTTTWTNLSNNLGDLPVTGLALDDSTGSLYISTDFGMAKLAKGSNTWGSVSANLPPATIYGITMSPTGHLLYAATHGRGIWVLDIEGKDD